MGNQLMGEVLDLPDYLNDDLSREGSSKKGDDEDTYAPFSAWLRCYSKEGMKNLKDGNGRTIWFQGSAGSLAPTGNKAKEVGRKKKYKVAKSGSDKKGVEDGEKMMNGEGVKEEAKYEPHEEDVKKVIKVKKEMTKKEESIMSNKTVAKGRRKTDKSEIKTGENVLGKT